MQVNNYQYFYPYYSFCKNGSKNFYWSPNLHNKIVQFFYQLNRIQNKLQFATIHNVFSHLLIQIYSNHSMFQEEELLLYKMILQTRDIEHGKGEYSLSYLLLYTLVESQLFCKSKYPLFIFSSLIHEFVGFENYFKKPIGSWKDAFGLWSFCIQYYNKTQASILIIDYLKTMVIQQLHRDVSIYNKTNENVKYCSISLLAKWIPRENKKNGFMSSQIAEEYYKYMFQHCNNSDVLHKAKRKCYMSFRKIISKLNKYINPIEIHMCENKRNKIHFENVEKKALLNYASCLMLEKKSNNQYITSDEKQGKNNFQTFVKERLEKTMVFSRHSFIDGFYNISDYELIKHAMNRNLTIAREIFIDTIWKQKYKYNKITFRKKNYIPIIQNYDKLSMNPFFSHVSLSLALRICELSTISRFFTFSDSMSHVPYDPNEPLSIITEKMKKNHDDSKIGSNIETCIDFLVDVIDNSNMSYDELNESYFVLISPMNFDPIKDKTMLIEFLKTKMKILSKKYNISMNTIIPKIIFWNIDSSNHFICSELEENIVFLSGYNVELLFQCKFREITYNQSTSTTLNYTCPYTKLKYLLNRHKYNDFNLVFNNYKQKNVFPTTNNDI